MDKKQALKELKELKDRADKLEAIINAPESLIGSITTYKQVCKALDNAELTLSDFSFLPTEDRKKTLAFHKLQQIAKLFNGDWKPDWKNSNQYKYYPYFNVASGGLGFCASGFDFSFSFCNSFVVYFKDKETSDYVGKTFLSIYKDFNEN
jgi:hypothetical protein